MCASGQPIEMNMSNIPEIFVVPEINWAPDFLIIAKWSALDGTSLDELIGEYICQAHAHSWAETLIKAQFR